MLVLCSHHITDIVGRIKNTMRFFEKFWENVIFAYKRDQDGCNVENQNKNALKPSDYNFQEISHFCRIFINGFLQFFIDFSVPRTCLEHFCCDFVPKRDRKYGVAPTSHPGCHTGSYSPRIMLLMFLRLCGVP